jgi:hypothetical protein
MEVSAQRQKAFRVAAGIIALLMGSFGIVLLVLSAMSFNPWYRWLVVAFGQLFFAWAFGAYALGLRGPYNWRSTGGS